MSRKINMIGLLIATVLFGGTINAKAETCSENCKAQVGSDKYATITEAISAIESSGEVTLLDSTTEDVVIPSGKTITLNLGSYTLTNVSSDTITVKFGATLIVNGSGTVDNVTHAKAAIYNNGTTTLNGGSYTRSKENGGSSESSGGNSFYNILNHGTMTINSGVTVKQSGKFSSLIDNGYYNYTKSDPRNGYVSGENQANPTLTINGGTFDGGLNTMKNDDGGILTINDGTFTNYYQNVVQNHNVATINGGTFDGSQVLSGKYPIRNCGCGADVDLGELTITGGTFIASSENNLIQDVSTLSTSFITITGGTFSDDADVTEIIEGTDYTTETVDGGYSVVLNTEITTDNGSVETDEGIQNDYTLVIEETTLTDEEEEKAESSLSSQIISALKNSSETLTKSNIIITYDISIRDSANNIVEVEEGIYEVSIKVDESLIQDYDSIKVAYLNEDGEVEELFDATYEDGYVKFTTTHFSTYSLVGYNTVTTPNTVDTTDSTTTTNPSTGDNVVLYGVIGLVSLIALGAVAYNVRKRMN